MAGGGRVPSAVVNQSSVGARLKASLIGILHAIVLFVMSLLAPVLCPKRWAAFNRERMEPVRNNANEEDDPDEPDEGQDPAANTAGGGAGGEDGDPNQTLRNRRQP